MKEKNVPEFLSPYKIVGIRQTENGSFITTFFYVKGVQFPLMEFASIRTLETGWSGGPETEVMTCAVRPIAVFDAY